MPTPVKSIISSLALLAMANNQQPMIMQNGTMIVDANDAAAQLFGYAAKEVMVGMDAIHTIAPGERQRCLEFNTARYQGREAPITYQTRCVSQGGREFPVSVMVIMVPNNGHSLSLVIFTEHPHSPYMESLAHGAAECVTNERTKMIHDTVAPALEGVKEHESRLLDLLETVAQQQVQLQALLDWKSEMSKRFWQVAIALFLLVTGPYLTKWFLPTPAPVVEPVPNQPQDQKRNLARGL